MGKYDIKRRTWAMVQVDGLYLSIEQAVEYGLRNARARKDLEQRYGLVFPFVEKTVNEEQTSQSTQEVMF